MTGALPFWVEVHVDDELLSADPGRWPQARELVATIAALAQDRGAVLGFRFRTTFARASRGEGVLPALVELGQEVGVHAHGSDLARATAAVRACGVQPTIAVPGLVQAGVAGRAALLAQCRRLGFTLITDHGPQPAWAYEGLMARQEQGLQVMAPTLRPFDWGLMEPDGRRHRLGPAQVDLLRRRRQQAAEQGARYLGLALHEHDLCLPGSLEPDPVAFDALGAFLAEGVVACTEVPGLEAGTASEGEVEAPRSPRLSDGRTRLVREVRTLASSVRRRTPSSRLRLGPRPKSPPGSEARRVTVGRDTLELSTWTPPQTRAIVLCSHAGQEGGRTQALRPFGLSPRRLLDRGLALWCYDRRGTGASAGSVPLTPGRPEHLEDWRAVLARARAAGLPVIALSWSAGVLPVLRAAAAGQGPDALVDGEGPADRWSLVPPGGNELSAASPWSEEAWAEVEPVGLLAELGCPYLRLQGQPDHVHGKLVEHARRMVKAAARAGLGEGPLQVLPGPLHGHPGATLEALLQALSAVGPGPAGSP